DTATVAAMLEELRGDVQATLTELRELAHGIYPPLLMDRGLGEALRAAANRSILAAEVRAEVGRFSSDVEAAVYFCCLEALQNAGKHAGAGARVTITVHAGDGRLCFEVADDGAGFDPSTVRRSHGFVNMEDRLGAIGGSLTIDASPGHGARVRGEIPLQASQS
ncbi:MAG TPA: ATP-binding protein, partial [Acidimicrobiia bacterium]|nr:ATP-binding protein [Acidimicrobiia bacterium]